MDPVKQGELCEVTIVLEGLVSMKALKLFKKVIDDAVDEARNLEDEDHGDAKLQVRLTRLVIR
jgi:hypothetical protein